MKIDLKDYNPVNIIKKDVKNFPVTFSLSNILILVTLISMWSDKITETLSIVETLFVALIVSFPMETSKKSNIKKGIIRNIPYLLFILGEIIWVVIVYLMNDANSSHSQYAVRALIIEKILISIEMLWLGIWDIPKLLYNVTKQYDDNKNRKAISIYDVIYGFGCFFGILIGISYFALIGGFGKMILNRII